MARHYVEEDIPDTARMNHAVDALGQMHGDAAVPTAPALPAVDIHVPANAPALMSAPPLGEEIL